MLCEFHSALCPTGGDQVLCGVLLYSSVDAGAALAQNQPAPPLGPYQASGKLPPNTTGGVFSCEQVVAVSDNPSRYGPLTKPIPCSIAVRWTTPRGLNGPFIHTSYTCLPTVPRGRCELKYRAPMIGTERATEATMQNLPVAREDLGAMGCVYKFNSPATRTTDFLGLNFVAIHRWVCPSSVPFPRPPL
jgi:hypothetical protein